MGGPDSLWDYHEIMENTFRVSNKQKISWYYIDNIIGTLKKSETSKWCSGVCLGPTVLMTQFMWGVDYVSRATIMGRHFGTDEESERNCLCLTRKEKKSTQNRFCY